MPTKQIIHRYGWKKDRADKRDLLFTLPPRIDLAKLPARVDLRPGCPPVYDQGNIGSCTANAIGGTHQFNQMKQPGGETFVPSRMFVYYNARAMIGTTGSDSGSRIRDGMKSINKQGVPPEPIWPYVEKDYRKKPSAAAYAEALEHQSIEYRSVLGTIGQIRGALAAGFPVVFGFDVYSSFESPEVARTGIMPVPKRGEKKLGGHAVLAVGYDDDKGVLIVRNSWGTGWGDKGYFFMPYAIIHAGQARDFWTLTLIEE
jgi:C1A family cysteine protease